MTLVERIYDLDGGIAEVADASIYSPGTDVGRPLSLSCNAYLIRRAGQCESLQPTGSPIG